MNFSDKKQTRERIYCRDCAAEERVFLIDKEKYYFCHTAHRWRGVARSIKKKMAFYYD